MLLFSSPIFFVILFLAGGSTPDIGVIQSIKKDSVMYANGYRYIEESVNNSFSPRNVSEAQFNENLKLYRQSRVNLYSCNVFVPGSLKLVGPAVNEPAVLGYVDTVLRRCREAGVQIVVLGSGEARRIPAGYDSVKASQEFIVLVRKMADLASAYGITVAIENLNHKETNFVLSVGQAIDIVKAVNRPSFRLTVDIYHMLVEDEPAEVIEQSAGILAHCHIAEETDRAYPGKAGVDFRPYFKAMKSAGYRGKIMIECRWLDFDKEAGGALQYLKQQLEEAWQR
jgi:sugar phosphate isomerase/epimerase